MLKALVQFACYVLKASLSYHNWSKKPFCKKSCAPMLLMAGVESGDQREMYRSFYRNLPQFYRNFTAILPQFFQAWGIAIPQHCYTSISLLFQLRCFDGSGVCLLEHFFDHVILCSLSLSSHTHSKSGWRSSTNISNRSISKMGCRWRMGSTVVSRIPSVVTAGL